MGKAYICIGWLKMAIEVKMKKEIIPKGEKYSFYLEETESDNA